MKHLLVDVLLWCVLFVFAVFGMTNFASLQQYSAVSLRYEKPFSGEAAYQARQYAIEHSAENTFWLTFWTEYEAQYGTEFNTVSAACLLFSGDAALVWPAEYLAGGMPGVTDGVGCAISSGLAWELWGGIDAIGKTIEVDSVPRVVRGIFAEKELIALLSVRDDDLKQSFTAVELSGGQSSPERSSVENFANASGLGIPDSVLMGTPTFLAKLMTMLPLIIFALLGLVVCISCMKKWPAALRKIVVFLIFFGVAILLPRFLDILPDWAIPTQWSDFTFWQALFKQAGENLREYIEPSSSLRDVGYAALFFKQIIITFVASGLTLFICLRWYRRVQLGALERRSNCG